MFNYELLLKVIYFLFSFICAPSGDKLSSVQKIWAPFHFFTKLNSLEEKAELAHCLHSKCQSPYPFQPHVCRKVWWRVLCSLRNHVSKCCWRSLQAISLQVCPPSWHDILKQAGQEEFGKAVRFRRSHTLWTQKVWALIERKHCDGSAAS